MAGSAFIPVFRGICRPILYANKQKAFAALRSRLFSIASTPAQGKWIKPFAGVAVPRLFGSGPLQVGNLPNNSRHYAKVPRDLSEDDDDSDESTVDDEDDLEDGEFGEEDEMDNEDDGEYTDSE